MIELTREVVYPPSTKITIIYTTGAGMSTARLTYNIN